MDVNDFRVLTTVLGFLCFVGICIWAYSKHAKSGFDEAAQLPFTDDDLPPRGSGRQSKEG
ncbi:cbb3-type cytochrome oxidase subunit 3 [Rhodocyclaceae bacterium SMB388]